MSLEKFEKTSLPPNFRRVRDVRGREARLVVAVNRHLAENEKVYRAIQEGVVERAIFYKFPISNGILSSRGIIRSGCVVDWLGQFEFDDIIALEFEAARLIHAEGAISEEAMEIITDGILFGRTNHSYERDLLKKIKAHIEEELATDRQPLSSPPAPVPYPRSPRRPEWYGSQTAPLAEYPPSNLPGEKFRRNFENGYVYGNAKSGSGRGVCFIRIGSMHIITSLNKVTDYVKWYLKIPNKWKNVSLLDVVDLSLIIDGRVYAETFGRGRSGKDPFLKVKSKGKRQDFASALRTGMELQVFGEGEGISVPLEGSKEILSAHEECMKAVKASFSQ